MGGAGFSGDFTPPRADGSSAHIDLGMAIVGIAEAPRPSKMSTNLISWYRATYDEWRSYPPNSLMTPAQREALLDQDLTDHLPQLGCQHFITENRLCNVPSVLIRQPLVPTEVLRDASPHHGTLGAVAQHIRATRPASDMLPSVDVALAAPTPNTPT